MLENTDRRQRRHDKTKRAILGEAKKLLRKNGLEKFSLRGVAEAVDYSPAGLYEYFANKEELLTTIAKGIEKELKEALETGVSGESLDDLILLGHQYIAFAKSHPEDYLLLFTSFSSGRRGENESLPETSAYMVLFNLVNQLITNKQIVVQAPVSVEEICYNYWILLHGHVMMQLTHLKGYEADFEALEQRMLQRFVTSLAS